MAKMILKSWDGLDSAITIGKEYEIYFNDIDCEYNFLDDVGEPREAEFGKWEDIKIEDIKELEFTINDFDEELKALLKRATRNGINIKNIDVNTINASTAEEERYVLMGYEVEYGRRG